MEKDKITIIGIAGGTGSGKTTVVKKIVDALPPHYVAVSSIPVTSPVFALTISIKRVAFMPSVFPDRIRCSA